MSRCALSYVALAVTDVSAVAETFERHLQLPRTDLTRDLGGPVPVFQVGSSALALFAPDDPFLGEPAKPGVHHIALATEDPPGFARAAGFVAEDAGVTGLNDTRQLLLDPGETLGVRIRLAEPFRLLRGTSEVVERIDHLGVACYDNAAATGVFSGRLGFAVESTQTDMEVQMAVESFTSDKYGVVYHSRSPRPVGGLRVSFLTVGDCELELLQPFDPNATPAPEDGPPRDGPGNTGGDKGAIGRYIARRGPGLHHIALKTRDINGALSRLAAAALEVIDSVGRPGSRRALIGFVHPRSLGGLLLHFVERDEL